MIVERNEAAVNEKSGVAERQTQEQGAFVLSGQRYACSRRVMELVQSGIIRFLPLPWLSLGIGWKQTALQQIVKLKRFITGSRRVQQPLRRHAFLDNSCKPTRVSRLMRRQHQA